MLLVAGPGPPIDITIYTNVSINSGPHDSNTLNFAKTKPRDRLRNYSNLIQVQFTAPAIVYNNRPRLMRCCVLNARSVRNKAPDFADYISDSKVDITVITETWLRAEDSAARIDATPPVYRLFDHPRPDRDGGGTGILVRDLLVAKKLKRVFLILLSTPSELLCRALLVCAFLPSIGRPTHQVIPVLRACLSQNLPSSWNPSL